MTGATRLVDDAGEVSLLGLSGPEVELLIEGQLSLISRLRGQLAESVDQALAVDRPGDVGAPNAASWLRGRFGPRREHRSRSRPAQGAAEGWLPDQRTPEQRLADALVEAGQRLLAGATLPAGGGDRPQLIVTIDHDRLAAGLGAGRLAGGEELAPSAVRRLACDAAIIPAVLGSASQPLDPGRSARTASPAQRRALALRDGGCGALTCRGPGCDRPPGWAEAHHLQRENLGPTDLQNLVALCGFHHRLIHREHWEIRPPKDGIRPLFIPPPWIDPQQRPRRNHLHHTHDILRTPP